MPPKKTAESSANGLTDGELRFIKAIFDNMTQKPDADWNKVAGDIGLKDAKCAKERFRQMSVRHGWREQGSAASTPRKPKAVGPIDSKITKKRTPKKKTKKEESDDEDMKQEETETVKLEDDAIEEVEL